MNLMRSKTPSIGLKATDVIVLFHKLSHRVLTSSMSTCEGTCGTVYASQCVGVCMCVCNAFFSPLLNLPVLLEWKWTVFEVFKCPARWKRVDRPALSVSASLMLSSLKPSPVIPNPQVWVGFLLQSDVEERKYTATAIHVGFDPW